MALVLVVLCLVFALAIIPGLWVKQVIRQHGHDRADFPGTGGEFARHLLNEMKLENVRVEETALGDHYDPEIKAVRLLPQHFKGRSLSAIVIAAHEVGHAMQDATGYAPLHARSRLAKQAQRFEQIGAVIMLAAPIIMILAKSPAILAIQVFIGLVIFSMTVLIHAVTLPTEFDASFRRALPVLRDGGYIKGPDLVSAQKILRAAALTYVAAAAMSILDVMRWLRVLRI